MEVGQGSPPCGLAGPRSLPKPQNGPLCPQHRGMSVRWQSAGDRSPGWSGDLCGDEEILS